MDMREFAENVGGRVILVKGRGDKLNGNLGIVIPAIINDGGVNKDSVVDVQQPAGLMLGFKNPNDEMKAIMAIISLPEWDARVEILHQLVPEILKPLFGEGESIEEFGYGGYRHRVLWDDQAKEVKVECLLDWGFGKNFRTAQFTLRKRDGEMGMVRRVYRQYTVGPDGIPTLSNEAVCNSLDELAERKICAGKTLQEWSEDFAEDYTGQNKADEVNRQVAFRQEKIGEFAEKLCKVVDAIYYKADHPRNGRWRHESAFCLESFLGSMRTPDDRPSGKPKTGGKGHGKPKTGNKSKTQAANG